jgi:penicillin amidase
MKALLRWLRWLFVWPDARPANAPPRSWLSWALTSLQGLLGLSAWRKSDGSWRNPIVWFLRSVQGVVVRVVLLVGLAVLTAYLLLRGSLPDLDGSRNVAGLSGEVRIERDALGIPTIHASSRTDLFLALGYVHAQDRFFQMDLSRRVAAGELAALLGPGDRPKPRVGPPPKPRIIGIDEYHRSLRLRETVRAFLARMTSSQRAELDAYVAGVNAGLKNLSVRPFEYLLLPTASVFGIPVSWAVPEPWTAEDTGLVVLTITLDLQRDNWSIERTRGVAHDTLPESLYQLLDARGTEWDAPMQGGPFATPRLPTQEEFDLRKEPHRQPPRPGLGQALLTESPVVGSNNWAIAGSETKHGRAILSCDMHLEIRVPNTWYRAGLSWPGHDGQPMKAWGATFPGTPGLVVGSNQFVAWGLTNAEVDTSDLVRLELDPEDPNRYKTPDGYEAFQEATETIRVRGGSPVDITVRSTRWGPLAPGDPDFALVWVAQQPEGLNLGWLDLLEARNLDEALNHANRIGGPQQNFVAADSAGDIGWTILGRIPRRVGLTGRWPVSWADGKCRWDGFYPPEQTPRIVRPAKGRIWTANNRVVGEPALSMIGESGFDGGARAKQIRDDLQELKQPTEAELFAIALDDRALFLARWRDLLLKVLEKIDGPDTEGLAWMRREVANSSDRAAADRIGYRLVLEFREGVRGEILGPLTARCHRRDSVFNLVWLRQTEGAVWKLIQERPAHLVNPGYAGGWDELLSKVALDVLKKAQSAKGGPANYTWGAHNIEHVEHFPLGGILAGVPYLGDWLGSWVNMKPRQADGAEHDMPRIQTRWQHGASERMTVSPGREAEGYFHMPCGQSGHPLSPHYRDMHEAWQTGQPTPFLPGPTVHTLTLKP